MKYIYLNILFLLITVNAVLAASPVISSFLPATGGNGTVITINGTNFTGATAVSFGSTAATRFAVISSTVISAVVDAGSSGNVTVTTPSGTSTLGGFTYIPKPIIAFTTPQVYTVGRAITILSPVNTGGAVPATVYGQVSTAAGTGGIGSLDGPATTATFNRPYHIVIDYLGNLLVSDDFNHLIRKITPAGIVSTVAGNGFTGSADGIGTAASFNYPGGLAIDALGNLFVADQQNNEIRKIASDGTVSTFAGSLSIGTNNGNRLSATFSGPTGITFDPQGNLYIADRNNNLLRKINTSGIVSTLAGSGNPANVNGQGTAASFNSLSGVVVGKSGDIYVADLFNQMIKKVTPAGLVTTLAGNGVAGSTTGPNAVASFSNPYGMAIDGDGDLFISDSRNNIIRRISAAGIVSTVTGNITAGSADGPPSIASFNDPSGLVVDGLGNLYATDVLNQKIRKICVTGYTISPELPVGLSFDSATGDISGTPLVRSSATDYTVTAYNVSGSNSTVINIATTANLIPPPVITYQTPQVYTVNTTIAPLTPLNTGGPVPVLNGYGRVTTIAGNGPNGSRTASANGTGTAASFNYPTSSVVDQTGNIYIADLNNNLIRKITPANVVTTFAGSTQGHADGTGTAASFNSPTGLAIDPAGNIYVADTFNNIIRKITPTGIVTTIAGNYALAGSTDGTGTGATFSAPISLACDGYGNIYVTCDLMHTIRKITPANVVTTFAGHAAAGSNDGIGTAAGFNFPKGLAVDAADNIYAADATNNLIRKITPAGVVTTVAGSTSGYLDGTSGTAKFAFPTAVAIDQAGNIYVNDQGNSRLRTITPGGQVTTLAGNAAASSVDGLGTGAGFFKNLNVAADGQGFLYITESNLIRKVSLIGYTIDKPLPTGLTFDITTGIISGKPTSQSPSTNYTVTAYNAGGSSSAVINITVNTIPVIPPNISYQTPQVYTVNNTITPLAPINTGGAVIGNGYGQVTTIAGNGPNGTKNGNTDGTALTASFNNPFSTVEDAVGNIYVADFGNNLIRKITPVGVVSTFAGGGIGHADGVGTAASFSGPYGMAIDAAGNIYVADDYNNIIRKITPFAVVTTIAGTAGASGYTDANGTAAKFGQLWALTIDGAGNLYITDQVYHSIRKMDAAGNVTTFAGRSGTAGSTDGTGIAASFYYPKGLATDAAGNVYVADSYNNLIRKITPAGVVTTIAGAGTTGSVNGVGLAAKFNNPTGIAVDAAGNLYVNDENNNVIRMITTGGIVSTLAGSGNVISIDGTGAGASFFHPSSISIDAQRNLYVTELNVIRKISMFGYVIDKPLPPGLSFDPSTGIISGTPTSTSPATNYTITAYNAGGSSSAVVNITVLDLPGQTITFNPLASAVYGTPDFSVAATSDNSTIPITYASSNPSVATITADGKSVHIVGVGQTIITASQAGNGSFKAATPVSQTLTVTPAPLTITADNKSRAYGSANPAFTFTYTGFVYGETLAVLTLAPAASTIAVLTSPVGSYPITPSGAAAANYSITYVTGTLTVTQAQLTITADNQTRTYGVANPILTLTYTGFLNGDDADKLTTQATATTTAVITSPIGQYPITPSGAVAVNYIINYINGLLTVTARPIIFNAFATKTTCDLDFDPGATGGDAAITYTSSNTSVATIVGGKVHIVSQGTTVITATDGITSIQQTLTVGLPNSAGLHIVVDTKEVCTGMPITFTALFTDPVINPIYTWYVNTIAVTGSNSSTFTFKPLKSNDTVYCHVEVPGSCFSGATNEVSNFIIDPYLTPTISIIPDKALPICSGTAVTFTAGTSNEGTSPSYQWKVNGINAGSNSKTFTSNAFADGDMVTCVLTSSGGKCFTTLTVPSLPSIVNITKAPATAVVVTASANSVYLGTAVTFTAAVSPAVTVVNYQWQVNGVNAGSNTTTFTSDALNNSDIITCKVTVNTGCSFTFLSSGFSITVLQPPVVIIPNTFTPNGDAINDTWELKNLEFYPNCTVRIFNRAGTTVFTSNNGYPIAWDGRYKNTILPVGTYYYIIDLKSPNQKILSGSVNLIK